jgi:uncharacterized RDD family membrane protein YckC
MDGNSTAGRPAGLLRRLAALLYDLLLVAALAMAATFAMLPLSDGEAILASTQGAIAHAYRAVLLLLVFGYFGASWTRSGQTLGMRAWHIELRSEGGGRLRWPGAAARFALGACMAVLAALGGFHLARPASPLAVAGAVALLAPLVLNFAWTLVDSGKRSVQDLAGGTRLLRRP